MASFNIVAPPACGRWNDHRLAEKLDPIFFPEMSPELAAIVGFVLDAAYTRPTLCAVFLDEGFVIAALSETENSALLTYDCLRRNWLGLLDAACLTPEERMEAECVFACRIGRPDLMEG